MPVTDSTNWIEKTKYSKKITKIKRFIQKIHISIKATDFLKKSKVMKTQDLLTNLNREKSFFPNKFWATL